MSLCKLVLFSITIFRYTEKILSLDVFEWAKWQVVLHYKPEVAAGSSNLKIRNRSGSNKKRSAADLPVKVHVDLNNENQK